MNSPYVSSKCIVRLKIRSPTNSILVPNNLTNTEQSAGVDVHGNNNKFSINKQSNSQVGDHRGFSSDQKENGQIGLPKCVILCFNSEIKIN